MVSSPIRHSDTSVGVLTHFIDGREFLVTSAQCVSIQGEDGRAVTNVNIAPFITNLPGGTSTTSFSTQDASGSTSMAAGVIEVRSRPPTLAWKHADRTPQAIELGADILLFDEDSCATNFLIRDRRMQRLIAADPITPLVYKACASPTHTPGSGLIATPRSGPRNAQRSQLLLHSRHRRMRCVHPPSSLSTTSEPRYAPGDYCDVADLVLEMRDYRCYDITEAAKQIAQEIPSAVPEHEG